jgi:hypothetical protein
LIAGCKVAKSSFCWTTAWATSPWRSLWRWTWSFATPAFSTCRQTWPRQSNLVMLGSYAHSKHITENDSTTYFWMATRTTSTIRKRSAFWMRSA